MTRSLSDRIERRLKYTLARQQLQRDLERMAGEASGWRGGGPVVGIASLSSGPWHLAIELLLAHALGARGARPELLTCALPDLPICDERTSDAASIDRCAGCLDDKRALLGAGGVPWRGLDAFVSPDAIARATERVAALSDDQLTEHPENGWPIGRWLHVSACHYLRCDARESDAAAVAARRRLLTSAIVTTNAIERWLDDLRPDVVMVQSGAHFMWRIALELARARGIPVVSREMGKGGWDVHLYSLNADSMSPDLDAAWDEARQRPLPEEQRRAVLDYIRALPERTYGAAHAPSTPPPVRRDGRRTLAVFTNVSWDLATAGRDVAFSGVLDWLRETIDLAAGHPDIDLIVRVHPAEASVMTRERIADRLREGSAALPRHVHIIDADDPTRASDLIAGVDLVSVYNSSVGIEAACYGAPVIVSGAPHFRARGFTHDIDTRESYRRLIAAWAQGTPVHPPADAQVLAERYAHLFFLRYHIPMGWTTSPLEPPFELLVRSLSELAPGANRSLDVVCDAILAGRQALLPIGETVHA